MQTVFFSTTCIRSGYSVYPGAHLLKSDTIATLESAHNITDMNYSVSPCVKVAVKSMDGKDLPELIEGLSDLDQGWGSG